MEDTKSSTASAVPERLSPTSLFDLPDELLCRIFELVQQDERAWFAHPVAQHELFAPFPVLEPYRGLNRLLHYRIVEPQVRRTFVVPAAVAIPEGAAWDTDADPRIVDVLRGREAAVASLVLVLPPIRPRPWIARLIASLPHLSDLTITGGIVVTHGLCAALRNLESLRKLSLQVEPDEARKLVDLPEKIDLERDVPSLSHLAVSFVTIPRLPPHERCAWVTDGSTKIRFLDIDAVIGPRVNCRHLEVLVLRAPSTGTHGAGEWLADILEESQEVPEWRTSSPFGLKKLVIDVVHAEFDLYTGWNGFDRVLDHLKYAPGAEQLEIRFSALFRCDAGRPNTAAPTIKRLTLVETETPSDGRQSANINGLEDFLDVFPALDSFSLTSHWYLPATDAADLCTDPDPPTDLSLAYDAPLLANLVMYVRDETPIKEFRYRRNEGEGMELRWTREGARGTHFTLSRWWL
ncbi:hypothetical protein JCM8208_000129 [Rhodotorula glutinis]